MDVTVASYDLKVVMNEEKPGLSDQEAKEIFAAEFQRALDDGYFVNIRYDSLTFEVTERTVLRIEDEDGVPLSDDERDHAETLPGQPGYDTSYGAKIEQQDRDDQA